MPGSVVFSLLLPAAFVIIMFGLGLSLRAADFREAVARPKPLVVALLCQVVVLPTLCFLLVASSSLSPDLAVGMMLLAASPGGSSAIIYTHLAKGDTALSITLNVINSAIALLTLPVIANLSMLYFFGTGTELLIAPNTFLQIILLAVVPTSLGILLKNLKPQLATRSEGPVRVAATSFLALVILFAVATQFDVIAQWAPVVGPIALAFNLLSLAIGYTVPIAFKVPPRQAIAIAMDIGIHNAAFVITLAMSEFFLNNAQMAIPPAIYALLAYVTAFVALRMYRRRQGGQI